MQNSTPRFLAAVANVLACGFIGAAPLAASSATAAESGARTLTVVVRAEPFVPLDRLSAEFHSPTPNANRSVDADGPGRFVCRDIVTNKGFALLRYHSPGLSHGLEIARSPVSWAGSDNEQVELDLRGALRLLELELYDNVSNEPIEDGTIGWQARPGTISTSQSPTVTLEPPVLLPPGAIGEDGLFDLVVAAPGYRHTVFRAMQESTARLGLEPAWQATLAVDSETPLGDDWFVKLFVSPPDATNWVLRENLRTHQFDLKVGETASFDAPVSGDWKVHAKLVNHLEPTRLYDLQLDEEASRFTMGDQHTEPFEVIVTTPEFRRIRRQAIDGGIATRMPRHPDRFRARVLDPEGHPLTGRKILLHWPEEWQGNESGMYHRLRVERDGTIRWRDGNRSRKSPSEGTLRLTTRDRKLPALHGTFRFEPNEVPAGLELDLGPLQVSELQPAFSLRIVDGQGEPVAGQQVRVAVQRRGARSGFESLGPQSETDENGQFVYYTERANEEFHVSLRGDEMRLVGKTVLRKNSHVELVALGLGRIAGEVMFPPSFGTQGARIAARSSEGEPSGLCSWRSNVSEPARRFELFKVDPGECELRFLITEQDVEWATGTDRAAPDPAFMKLAEDNQFASIGGLQVRPGQTTRDARLEPIDVRDTLRRTEIELALPAGKTVDSSTILIRGGDAQPLPYWGWIHDESKVVLYTRHGQDVQIGVRGYEEQPKHRLLDGIGLVGAAVSLPKDRDRIGLSVEPGRTCVLHVPLEARSELTGTIALALRLRPKSEEGLPGQTVAAGWRTLDGDLPLIGTRVFLIDAKGNVEFTLPYSSHEEPSEWIAELWIWDDSSPGSWRSTRGALSLAEARDTGSPWATRTRVHCEVLTLHHDSNPGSSTLIGVSPESVRQACEAFDRRHAHRNNSPRLKENR